MKTLALTMFAALLLAAPLLIAQSANAAPECTLTIDRTPCPGKEDAAKKPYAGKNPTEEKTRAKDEASCIKDAEKAVKIIRKGTLSKKVATAKFDGKDLGSKEDSAACK
jgi:hypothetical protein